MNNDSHLVQQSWRYFSPYRRCHVPLHPAALSSLTRLVSLSLSNSELYQLPQAVQGLPLLRVRQGCVCCRLHPARRRCFALHCTATALSFHHAHHCCLCTPALQHLYLEHNELRVLPGGQWWSRLHVLSLDWEPLLRSGHELLASVSHAGAQAGYRRCHTGAAVEEEKQASAAYLPPLLWH